MTTGRKLKIALVIFLVFFSGLALLPNFYSGLPEWWTKYCAPAGINLGLDLKGDKTDEESQQMREKEEEKMTLFLK